MGTVISLAAHRFAATETAPDGGSAPHHTTMPVDATATESLGETIARMRSSLRLAAEALRTVATEARASADAYRMQAAEIRRQADGMQTAMQTLKGETAEMAGAFAARR